MKIRLGKLLHPLLIVGVIFIVFMIVSDEGNALTYDEAIKLDWGNYDISGVERILKEDMTQPSSLSEEQKEACLIGDMRGFYKDFDKVSEGIKYEALTAISALETGHFKSDLAKYGNNVGGLRGRNGYFHYATKQEGIEAFSNLLTEHYLSPDGCYYEGVTILDVSKHYNQSTHWVQLYVKIRLDMERRIENVPGIPTDELFLRGLYESLGDYDLCLEEIESSYSRYVQSPDSEFSKFTALSDYLQKAQEVMLVSCSRQECQNTEEEPETTEQRIRQNQGGIPWLYQMNKIRFYKKPVIHMVHAIN